jgi:hypothetical protein
MMLLLATVAGCASGSGSGPTTVTTAGTQPAASSSPARTAGASRPAIPAGPPSRFTKAMVIVEENKTDSEVLGSRQAPYLRRLSDAYGRVSKMDAGYPQHCPSLPAYLLMTSGSTQGVCDSADPSEHPLNVPNVFQQVAESGREWRAYAEGMPRPCLRSNYGDYLVRHVPSAYYVTELERCPRSQVPLGRIDDGALRKDLDAGKLPAYSFVTPNRCNDMHGGPTCSGDNIAAGDRWLSRLMPTVERSPDFRSGRLLVIITWDEGSDADNHIPTLLVGRGIRGVRLNEPATLCTVLRTTEHVLGLPFLGCAAAVPPFRASEGAGSR